MNIKIQTLEWITGFFFSTRQRYNNYKLTLRSQKILALCEIFFWGCVINANQFTSCPWLVSFRNEFKVQIKSLIPIHVASAQRYDIGLFMVCMALDTVLDCQSSIQWTEMFRGRPTNYLGTDLWYKVVTYSYIYFRKQLQRFSTIWLKTVIYFENPCCSVLVDRKWSILIFQHRWAMK